MLTDLVFTEGMLCVNFEERTYVNVVTDRGILFFFSFFALSRICTRGRSFSRSKVKIRFKFQLGF